VALGGDVRKDMNVAEKNQHDREQELTGRSEGSLHHALDDAGKLYAQYLEVAQVADVARLAYDADRAAEYPPPSNLPLTLEIHTNF
jgi:hypothetical protein